MLLLPKSINFFPNIVQENYKIVTNFHLKLNLLFSTKLLKTGQHLKTGKVEKRNFKIPLDERHTNPLQMEKKNNS
jgi:hypothetical protein